MNICCNNVVRCRRRNNVRHTGEYLNQHDDTAGAGTLNVYRGSRRRIQTSIIIVAERSPTVHLTCHWVPFQHSLRPVQWPPLLTHSGLVLEQHSTVMVTHCWLPLLHIDAFFSSIVHGSSFITIFYVPSLVKLHDTRELLFYLHSKIPRSTSLWLMNCKRQR